MMQRVVVIVVLLLLAPVTSASRIGDITRLSTQRNNTLTGMGLVIGLKGTGDGGDYLPAIRPLAEMLGRYSNSSTVAELTRVKNVALVMISADVPVNARSGDTFDVHVHSIGSSSSLRGGRLYLTPMMGPIPNGDVYAMATGAVVIEESGVPTVGIVRRGGTMEVDLPVEMVDSRGRFTLVLDDAAASWTTASVIAKMINDSEDGSTWAIAIDPKNVLVTIPPGERETPDAFISRVQRLPLPLIDSEARVVINERTGTMVITGDVAISPVVITHKGLTISTRRPEPVPTDLRPVIETAEFVKLDPLNRGNARLQDLLDALDQLKVPAADKIAIIKLLHESGKLHAKLLVE